MGMCASVEIFQTKLDKLLGGIEGIKMYIDDILVLRKDSSEIHIDELIIIFSRIRVAVLQLNASNCSFGLK